MRSAAAKAKQKEILEYPILPRNWSVPTSWRHKVSLTLKLLAPTTVGARINT